MFEPKLERFNLPHRPDFGLHEYRSPDFGFRFKTYFFLLQLPNLNSKTDFAKIGALVTGVKLVGALVAGVNSVKDFE